jgi:hypothetical protein
MRENEEGREKKSVLLWLKWKIGWKTTAANVTSQ